jgi:hypothetical protein
MVQFRSIPSMVEYGMTHLVRVLDIAAFAKVAAHHHLAKSRSFDAGSGRRFSCVALAGTWLAQSGR